MLVICHSRAGAMCGPLLRNGKPRAIRYSASSSIDAFRNSNSLHAPSRLHCLVWPEVAYVGGRFVAEGAALATKYGLGRALQARQQAIRGRPIASCGLGSFALVNALRRT